MPEFAVPQSTYGETIATLYDGDYHFGLAAMVNSLARAGYKGTVWAGHRGPVPPWTSKLKRLEGPGQEYMAGDNIRIAFIPVSTDIHLSLYKPQYLKRLLGNEAKGASYIWFFDSDMFVRGGWGFFQQWARRGVAVVQDINYRVLPALDPLRHQWMDICREMGWGEPKRAMDLYFNGGLTGVAAEHASFLDLWERLIAKAGELGMDLKKISSGTRDMPFHIPDQDALNISVMYTEHPVSPTGPEVMGFLPGRTHLYHCTGPKPWRGSLLMRALKGEPPSRPVKFYFTQVETPIALYTPFQLRRLRLEVAIGALIGRFYSRR